MRASAFLFVLVCISATTISSVKAEWPLTTTEAPTTTATEMTTASSTTTMKWTTVTTTTVEMTTSPAS